MSEREIVRTDAHSPSVSKRVWTDGTHDYICTWPACGYHATKIQSVGSHYRGHSGKAARRRRGEDTHTPRTAAPGVTDLRILIQSIADSCGEALRLLDSIEDRVTNTLDAEQTLSALKDLLN